MTEEVKAPKPDALKILHEEFQKMMEPYLRDQAVLNWQLKKEAKDK